MARSLAQVRASRRGTETSAQTVCARQYAQELPVQDKQGVDDQLDVDSIVPPPRSCSRSHVSSPPQDTLADYTAVCVQPLPFSLPPSSPPGPSSSSSSSRALSPSPSTKPFSPSPPQRSSAPQLSSLISSDPPFSSFQEREFEVLSSEAAPSRRRPTRPPLPVHVNGPSTSPSSPSHSSSPSPHYSSHSTYITHPPRPPRNPISSPRSPSIFSRTCSNSSRNPTTSSSSRISSSRCESKRRELLSSSRPSSPSRAWSCWEESARCSRLGSDRRATERPSSRGSRSSLVAERRRWICGCQRRSASIR